MITTPEKIQQLLATNWHWTTGSIPFKFPVTFQQAVQEYEKEKRSSVYFLDGMMARSEQDNGNERAMEIWAEMERGLVTAQMERGPHRIMKAIYRKASLAVQQRHAKDPKRVGHVLDEMLFKSQGVIGA